MVDKSSIDIDRAIHELRCGRGINVDGKLVFHPEFIDKESFVNLKQAKIIIKNHRAEALTGKKFPSNVEISLNNLSFDDLQLIIAGKPKANFKLINNTDKTAKACVELAKSAEFLPAIIIAKPLKNPSVIKISRASILKYLSTTAQKFKLITEAPLNLTDADKARILAFRSDNSTDEHYAIIIGDLGSEPLVRIHSSCYTGDLLASLSCDCGDQLRGAIKLMNKAGGGIILYLMQEGRGIGLINKLRAYQLQSKGLDTVEANEFLGFDDEERSFEPAAAILKQLKIGRVKLVTNNPKKISGLEHLGIKVIDRIPLVIKHVHNQTYLKVKSKKSGHIIN